jgi:hypothetical protein
VFAISCSVFGGSGPIGAPPAATSYPATPEQTQEAIAVLARMTEFLTTRATLRFEADIYYDAVQASGQKLEFGSHREIAVAPPNRVRIEVSHAEGERELVTFDGERLSASLPRHHVYASIPYTGTIADALDHLVTEYDVETPLADLLRPSLAEDVAKRAISGRNLGPVTIGSTPCDHLAFRGELLDFQLYVARGDEPVPMRFVIDYHAEIESPQFRASLSSWEFASSIPDALFRFVPAAGAQRVTFAELLDLLFGPSVGLGEGGA